MRLNKIIPVLTALVLLGSASPAYAAYTISQGGTATSTAPAYGQTFVGNKTGGWDYVATSTFGGGGGAVSSVFGRTGAVVATSGDYTTAMVTELTNLYFTTGRVLATTLAGFSATTGTISSSDTVLTAIEKLAGNAANYLTNITGLVTPGTNVTITGSGTSGSPYVINATGGSSFGYPFPSNATSTLLTFSGGITTGGTVTLGTLTGVLHGTSGVVSASAVDLTSEVTGTLPVTNGGTGANTFPAGARFVISNGTGAFTSVAAPLTVSNGGTGSTTLSGVLKGNGTGIIATAVLGTDYVNGSGVSGNCVQWGAGNSLTDAGAVCGTGGGGGITTLGPNGQGQTGATQTLATTTSTTNGLTSALKIVGSGNTQTFTPSLSGILTTVGGGNGLSNPGSAGAPVLVEYYGSSGAAALPFGASGTVLNSNGTDIQYSKLNLASTNSFSNSLLVSLGGTASTTLTGILKGNGTSAVQTAIAGTDYQAPISGTTGQNVIISPTNTASATSTIFTSTASNVGVGTTTPAAKFTVSTSVATSDALDVTNSVGSTTFRSGTSDAVVDSFGVASSTGQAEFGVDAAGHNWTGGLTPTLTSCGGGTPAVTGDDNAGTITLGTGLTSACTLTFKSTWTQTPTCSATADAAGAAGEVTAISTTAVTFGVTVGNAGGKVYYSCRYHHT